MSELFKIKKLHIGNFKRFENIDFDFESKNLVVFDGPNGYGKTTSFEAIEILFAKEPRRIKQDPNINATYSYQDSPIHNNSNEPIEISIELENSNELLKIKRIFPPSEIGKSQKKNIKQIFKNSQLFINDKPAEEDQLAETLAYENIAELFNVLNYVEQDENTFFLKKNPIDRYKGLVSILGVEKELNDYSKLLQFKRKVRSLISKYEREKKGIEGENKELIENSLSDVPFNKLISNKDHSWDSEKLVISDVNIRNSILREIEKIEELVNNAEDIDQIILERKIVEYENSNFYNELLQYYWGLNNYDEVLDEIKTRENLIKERALNKYILDNVQNDVYDELINNECLNQLHELGIERVKEFEKLIKEANDLKSRLTQRSKILENLKRQREAFIQIIEDHKNEIGIQDGLCPLCGFDWESNSELVNHLELTENLLFEQYKSNNEQFEELKKIINSEYFEEIVNLLIIRINAIDEILKNLLDESFKKQINFLRTTLPRRISEFLNLFNEDDRQSIIRGLNKRDILQRLDLSEIQEKVQKIRPANLSKDLNHSDLLKEFAFYFDNSMESLKAISKNDIIQKRNYINFNYLLTINSRLNKIKRRIFDLVGIEKELEDILGVFNDEIRNYTSDIINNITIPFYIISGKVLQNHTLGSGIVFTVDTDRETQIRIRPRIIDQEASHTLSSGQLSATVVSLMLVLNMVYNKSKLGTILIDDPIQTLDEINIHSLVEVLKYHFADQQIVISTHEDRYSKFIRYKYDKFGLSYTSLRLMDYNIA